MGRILRLDTLKKIILVFGAILVSLLLIHVLIAVIDIDLSAVFSQKINSKAFLVDFAPEIWLTLLSIVLGTLIIVISIASQSNPKLIDYYIGDYPSLFYTCAITIAGMENIFLQLDLSVESLYWNNVIFVNAYILLPLSIINAIPYTFYILSYTKTSSLIQTIALKNKKTIQRLLELKKIKCAKGYQFIILDTINQLDDQHGYVNFKEPKSQIINALSEIFQFYILEKQKIDPLFFQMTDVIKSDISFRTMSDKFDQIEEKRTFVEHKILRIYSGIYNQLIEKGNHDLASQCANELFRIGRIASRTNNKAVSELVLMQFNTYLRFGIKYAIQQKDIRNVYNCVFHYTQLVLYLIETHEERMIIRSCEYLTYYAKEIHKLSFNENHFIFLIDAFASEIQRILIALHKSNSEKEIQMKVLKIYATFESVLGRENQLIRIKNNSARSIKIGLILFYINRQENSFVRQLIDDIIEDLQCFDEAEVMKLIRKDCAAIMSARPTFWEYTDRGDKNIYFSPYKYHLKEFFLLFKISYRHVNMPFIRTNRGPLKKAIS